MDSGMRKKSSLVHKTLLQFLMCTAIIFVLMTPLFYLLTKLFYAEDLIDVIQAVERGEGLPPIDLERDIMAGVMLQFVMTFVLLSVAMFVTVRYISRRVWKGFDDTLAKTERFNLAQGDVPDFAPTDIMEFSRLNDSLQRLMRKNKETYRIQKEFTENASHELQTPLAVIRSKLDLLMQEDLTERQLHLVSDMYQLNTRMGRLNRNLLLLAKIENLQYCQMKTIMLKPFLQDLLPSWHLLQGNREVRMECDGDPGLAILANPVLFESLVNNLVVNAIRYTASGEICVHAYGATLLEISNHAEEGPLDPGEIFSRFRSGGSSKAGTGLGLAIVKAICDFHGWDIKYTFQGSRHVFSVSFHSSRECR